MWGCAEGGRCWVLLGGVGDHYGLSSSSEQRTSTSTSTSNRRQHRGARLRLVKARELARAGDRSLLAQTCALHTDPFLCSLCTAGRLEEQERELLRQLPAPGEDGEVYVVAGTPQVRT